MKILLTFDYEIYFGDQHGSVDRCIIQPTNSLVEIAEREQVQMTFFIDICFIQRLRQFADKHEGARRDLEKIENQVHELVAKGHDCQLHLHPHWLDCNYEGENWKMDVSRYKLADFSKEEANGIIARASRDLQHLTGQPVHTFRAGGWCIQPWSHIREAFLHTDIRADSTVFRGGVNLQGAYAYDFRHCPDRSIWKFSDHECEEDPNGPFSEMPIASQQVSPWFFWKLFGWGRLDPANHKPIGDGFPIPGGGSKKKILTQRTLHPVSSDGYFVTLMNSALNKASHKEPDGFFVTIGHPKACTRFSLKKLEQFIRKNRTMNQFTTYSQLSARND